MSSNNKIKVLFGNAATADVYLALRLDEDLYDSGTRALVGATTTNTGNKPEIPINKRYAVASGLVQEKNFVVERGTGITRKTRQVPMLVRKDLADTIDAAATATTNTLKLGRGTTTANWTVKNVV
jgi:hypothetical protein